MSRKNQFEAIPADGLQQVLEEARQRASSEGDEAGIPLEEADIQPEEAGWTAARPSSGRPGMQVAEAVDELKFLGTERKQCMRDVRDKPALLKIIDWYMASEDTSETKACFHTTAGLVRIPVRQYVRVEEQSVLVLMLGDPNDVTFFPPTGATLDFSLQAGAYDVITKRPMTILSGPWALPGFPVSFLMLWEAEQRSAISVDADHEST